MQNLCTHLINYLSIQPIIVQKKERNGCLGSVEEGFSGQYRIKLSVRFSCRCPLVCVLTRATIRFSKHKEADRERRRVGVENLFQLFQVIRSRLQVGTHYGKDLQRKGLIFVRDSANFSRTPKKPFFRLEYFMSLMGLCVSKFYFFHSDLGNGSMT